MKQLFLHRGAVRIEQVPLPQPEENTVLVRTSYSFISTGTEMATIAASGTSLTAKVARNFSEQRAKFAGAIREHGIRGTIALVCGRLHQRMPLGYSCSGQVVAVGSKIQRFRPGDYVACAGANWAGHADFVTVPEQLIAAVPEPRFLKQSSIVAIGSIALHAIRRANLQLGETVVVVGLGLIGQLTIQLAKHAGCRVIGVEVDKDRLALARSLGADIVLDPACDVLEREVAFLTNQHGADVTIITASSPTGHLIDSAIGMTRRKGKLVLVGDVKLEFAREQLYNKEIDFLISCSYGPGRYDPGYEEQGRDYPLSYVRWTENRNMGCVLDLITRGVLRVDPLIWHEYRIDQAAQAYQDLGSKRALGVVLSYNLDDKKPSVPLIYNSVRALVRDVPIPYVAPSAEVGLACVGVGGFARTKLLPIISSLPGVQVRAIVDSHAATAQSIAAQYKATYSDNTLNRVLDDPSINAVVIATPHYLHADQAIACLSAGKAVFVEKPAAVLPEELDTLYHFLCTNPGMLYCVDFNRPFSPFMRRIKQRLMGRSTPLMIFYRMNVGLLSRDHWIQSAANGGRVIGEACHIFDLFCALTDSVPVSVSVQVLGLSHESVVSTDNFVATITMRDGSCCTLTYTALGSGMAGKEYFELHVDGKTVTMDNFQELHSFGGYHGLQTSSAKQDKGHQSLLEDFIKAAGSWPDAMPPIPYERIVHATRLSLAVDELVRAGGGIMSLVPVK